MGKAIGIDLGTTNCCVCVLEGGAVQIVPNKEGGRTTPSVVGFTDKGERLVGQIAKRQAVTNASNTVYAVKRLIGRKFNSPEVERARETSAFEIVDSPNGDARVRVQGRSYSPPELSGIVLQRLKAAAEDFLGEPVTHAIITVPAYFDDSQRQATKDAGKIAGLQVERIINEPTAAALAYGLGKTGIERIAVYDLGGGTFDISILEMNDGVFEVLSTSGNTFLGGEDLDERIMNWMADEFAKDSGIDLRQDRLALQRLKEVAERAKCELSSVTETAINLPFIAADASGPKHFNKTLNREQFEDLVGDLIEQTIEPCQQALRDAKLQATPALRAARLVPLDHALSRQPRLQPQEVDVVEPRLDPAPRARDRVDVAVREVVAAGIDPHVEIAIRREQRNPPANLAVKPVESLLPLALRHHLDRVAAYMDARVLVVADVPAIRVDRDVAVHPEVPVDRLQLDPQGHLVEQIVVRAVRDVEIAVAAQDPLRADLRPVAEAEVPLLRRLRRERPPKIAEQQRALVLPQRQEDVDVAKAARPHHPASLDPGRPLRRRRRRLGIRLARQRNGHRRRRNAYQKPRTQPTAADHPTHVDPLRRSPLSRTKPIERLSTPCFVNPSRQSSKKKSPTTAFRGTECN